MRNKILFLFLLIPFLAHGAGGTAATKLVGPNATIYEDVGGNSLYFPTLTASSLTYINASGDMVPLALGSGLSLNMGTLSATGSSGTVTSITATSPLTGGTITTSGSIGLPASLVNFNTLGNPGTSGYVLSSTTGGTLSWINGGGSLSLDASMTAAGFIYGSPTAGTLYFSGTNAANQLLQLDGSDNLDLPNQLYASGHLVVDANATLKFPNGNSFNDTNGNIYGGDGNVLFDATTTPLQLNYPGLGDAAPLADSYGGLYGGGTRIIDTYGNFYLSTSGGLIFDASSFAGVPGQVLTTQANGVFWEDVDLPANMNFDAGDITSDGAGNISAYGLGVYQGFFNCLSSQLIVDGELSVDLLNRTLVASDGSTILLQWDTAADATASVQALLAFYTGTYSATGAATSSFVVTIGASMPDTNYTAGVSPLNPLSAAGWYISSKTTTTFTVTYLTSLTGAVAFDWSVVKQ